MKALAVFILIFGLSEGHNNDTATRQLITFKEEHPLPIGIMTTSAGSPVEYRDAEGVLKYDTDIVNNEFFLETLLNLDRETAPERVVHARGAGAFGYFEVTHDLADVTKAKVFSKVGKKTPVAVRFSPVLQNKGGADTTRENRGLSIKFYTEEGNLDLAMLNIDIFILKDPTFFPAFARSFKRNPKTHLADDPNMRWDFITQRPESIHAFLLIFGDRGIPKSYRHLPGFGIHTFQMYNEKGEIYFVRIHVLPDAGIDYLTSEEGNRLRGINPDYATQDLYDAIAKGYYPTWTFSVQVISFHDVEKAKFDIFDVTKRWPLEDYPLRPVGKLVLNKNPENYFAQVEQLAFNPANLVPGILGGVDKIFESRRLSYRDAQNYRLGGNHNKIQVNCPLRHPLTYNRDGVPPVKYNGGERPKYYPNSFSGPVPYLDKKRPQLVKVLTDPNANNFDQASDLYESYSRGEKMRLAQNIVTSLRGAAKFLQERAIKLFNIINTDLAHRVEYGLMTNNTKWQYYKDQIVVLKT